MGVLSLITLAMMVWNRMRIVAEEKIAKNEVTETK